MSGPSKKAAALKLITEAPEVENGIKVRAILRELIEHAVSPPAVWDKILACKQVGQLSDIAIGVETLLIRPGTLDISDEVDAPALVLTCVCLAVLAKGGKTPAVEMSEDTTPIDPSLYPASSTAASSSLSSVPDSSSSDSNTIDGSQFESTFARSQTTLVAKVRKLVSLPFG